MFYIERKKKALEALESAERVYNIIGSAANYKATELYNLRKCCSVAIKNVETYVASLSNSPQNYKKDVVETQICIKEFNHAVAIENDYLSGKVSAAGVIAGSAIATLGPTAAMTIATTFGTASTGTAIASLSGAAASNAALAWLGGGAIAAGGGMVVGKVFLALAGPVGWGIAGALGVGGGLMKVFNNKKTAEKAEAMLYEIKPKTADLERKLQELRYIYTETEKLLPAINVNLVCKGFPKDYDDFSHDQKLRLGAVINSTIAMGKLINRRIS